MLRSAYPPPGGDALDSLIPPRAYKRRTRPRVAKVETILEAGWGGVTSPIFTNDFRLCPADARENTPLLPVKYYPPGGTPSRMRPSRRAHAGFKLHLLDSDWFHGIDLRGVK